jgi:hypothetical protein
MTRFWYFIPIFLYGQIGCAAQFSQESEPGSITFLLHRPMARSVQFMSSLDGYTVRDTQPNELGMWKITLPAGENFSYFYRVDGATFLPDCQFQEMDDFGARNCLYLP